MAVSKSYRPNGTVTVHFPQSPLTGELAAISDCHDDAAVQPSMMGAMYTVDELDRPVKLEGIPLPDTGAPSPMVFVEEHHLVLSYWLCDQPPYPPTTAPLAIVRFSRPYFHMFGPPNDEAFAGHPLADRGLDPYGAFRVEKSSLIRSLERMNSVHRCHNPTTFDAMTHYIFTFHDSTFECVAHGYDSSIVRGPIASTVPQMASLVYLGRE